MGNMLRHSQQQHHTQINCLALNIDKLIPDGVIQILKIASDRIRSQNPANYDLSKLYAPKDIFNLIHRKDGDEKMAEIVCSGFNLMTPLRDFHNGTCLHLIANFGSLTMAYLILSRANSHNFVNLMDKEMRTPIMYAVAGKKNDILKLLCQCGADVTLKGPDGMTVLHLAAKSGNIQATQIILENYRQIATISKLLKFINTTDDGSWTAMVWAAENGHGDIVSYLISLGADPNICDSENNTVLHWACLAGKIESIYPLAANTDPNIQNIHGDTALHISARQSKTKICMILMGQGANLNIKNLSNETPLDIVDEKSECGKLLKFNSELRQIGIGGWKSNFGNKLVLCK
jgi:[histone H3]-lysine9 N-trimethyltransferase EHMT